MCQPNLTGRTVCMTRKPLQKKKRGLPIPDGTKFIYIGKPGPGVVTVAWISPVPGVLHLGFSFCSPRDRWCKVTGRDMALARLLNPTIAVPYLYDAQRTAHEVVRAVLSHEFGKLEALCPGTKAWGHCRVPSWTKDLAKSMETKRVSGISEIHRSSKNIKQILALLKMADEALGLGYHTIVPQRTKAGRQEAEGRVDETHERLPRHKVVPATSPIEIYQEVLEESRKAAQP